MNIAQRLARLERAAPEPPCPSCGGAGRIEFHVRTLSEPEPEPSVCPVCGRGPGFAFTITKTYAEDLDALAARQAAGEALTDRQAEALGLHRPFTDEMDADGPEAA